MKIFYEDSMPYAAEFFSDLGECQVFSHKSIDANLVATADVLLVRSTTKVNHKLLADNQSVSFVGTATAGTDHIDKNYLAKRGIPFVSAGGCNAVAVAEYVLSVLVVMSEKLDWQLANKTVGIVGAGHVGTALSKILDSLGMAYKLCDPPLAKSKDTRQFVDMDEIMQCDVITLHVPWVKDGPNSTQHLFDKNRLAALSPQQILVNACRGEVIDNQAALDLLQQGQPLNLVLDVWENEPHINVELVPHIALATAHIAGHSIEGKARGTEMLYRALCQQLGIQPSKKLADYLPTAAPSRLAISDTMSLHQVVSQLVLEVYDIAKDDQNFKAKLMDAEQFRYIRKHYPIRREFSAITVNAGNFADSEALYQLGFKRTK